MKKKTAKIWGGVFLAAVFIIVVLILVFQPYLTKDSEEETIKEAVSVKPSKQVYEIGEDMEIEGIVLNVSETELIEDYDKIDAFYKERGFLINKEEYVRAYIEEYADKDLFSGDIRYFRIKCSVANDTENPVNFSPDSLYPVSMADNHMVSWEFDNYDVKVLSNSNSKTTPVFEGKRRSLTAMPELSQVQPYTLAPKEYIELEVVGQICLYDRYQIHPEYTDSQECTYDLYVMGSNSTKRIHLNLKGSFDDQKSIYIKSRDIPKMKSESWTNLQQKIWRDEFRKMCKEHNIGYSAEGYPSNKDEMPIIETEEPGQQFLELMNKDWTETGEIEVSSAFSLKTTLTGFEVLEWKDLPLEFAGQGNLQRMAKRYHDIHNCQEEELKVLLLDLDYTSSQIGELEKDEKRAINYFYERSKLYIKVMRDDKEALQLFGTADDWIVTENSAHPENIGPTVLDYMELDAKISIRMAYILPPQIYKEYSALYFTGGKYEVGFDTKDRPITKIVLS